MPKLPNPKRERFCQEFIIDLNGKKAAERAKYSKKTAEQQASRLLSNVKVQERIAELMKKRSERTRIAQDRVLQELAMIGFSDLRNYIDIDRDTGAIRAKGFEDMPEGESRVLKSIKEDRVIKEDADGEKTTVYDKVKFELWDKPKALEMIGRHLAMFVERHQVNANMTLTVISAVPRPKKNKKNTNSKKRKKK